MLKLWNPIYLNNVNLYLHSIVPVPFTGQFRMLAAIFTDLYVCEISGSGVSEKVKCGDSSTSFWQQGYVAPQMASTELLAVGLAQWQ